MNLTDMKPHPLAARMPKQAKHERAFLVESMKAHGFDHRHPIVVWLDPKIGEDRILDGVHRRDVGKDLGIPESDWPFTRFEGTHAEAAKWVFHIQAGRRSLNDSQRAILVAQHRKDLKGDGVHIDLEQAADMADVSVSLMEKASGVVNKSASKARSIIRGELTVNQAVNQMARTQPESRKDGEDPREEIRRTTDKAKAAIDALVKWQMDYLECLFDRRGAEQLSAAFRTRTRTKDGGQKMTISEIDNIVTTIRRNMFAAWCPTCNGMGCGDCGDRRYVTTHELAVIRNQRKDA